VALIEPVVGRSWKAVELFGCLRLCVSHFYLRPPGANPVSNNLVPYFAARSRVNLSTMPSEGKPVLLNSPALTISDHNVMYQ